MRIDLLGPVKRLSPVIALCLLGAGLQTTVEATVIPYPLVGGVSGQYSVTVNGTQVPVNIWDDIHYAHFAFSGSAAVEVTNKDPQQIDQYTISPKRLGIQATVSGDKLSFTLNEPRKLILDIEPANWVSPSLSTMNGDPRFTKVTPTKLLFIFAEPLETDPPMLGDPGVFDVNAQGVASAISAASNFSGGGVAYFPTGSYSLSLVNVPSNVTIYLEPGAFIESGSNRPFVIENSSNVRIMGRGTLQARGTVLEPYKLTDFVIQDVILRNTWNEQWCFVPRYLSNALVSNVKVLTPRAYARDGIDPDNSSDLTIENSFVYSGDDSLCIKAGNDRRGYTHEPQQAIGSARIIVRNNIFWTWWSAMKLGYEIDDGVPITDITFENNVVVYAKMGITLTTIQNSPITNVIFRNNHIEKTDSNFLHIENGGDLENLVIENLVVDSVRGISVSGSGSVPEDTTVNFVNLEVAGQPINSLEDLQNLGAGVNVSNAIINFSNSPTAPAAPSNLTIQ